MVVYNFRYPGQYYDLETGLNYNYFRHYDPQTGRYVESDPIGLTGGVGTYSYSSGDPVSGFDSSGLFAYNKPPPATVPVPREVAFAVSCIENCLRVNLVVTGGAEQSGHTAGSLHYSGQAVDFGFNSNPGLASRASEFFCCARTCGFTNGQQEGGKRPPHFHVQTAPGNGVPSISGACQCVKN